MVIKLTKYLWSVRGEFFKYFLVGFSGLFLDMGTLILFTRAFGWSPVFSVVVGQILVLSYNFTLNKYWSFKNKTMPHKQIVRYIILASWNYVFSVGTMYIFNQNFGFDFRLVRLLSIVTMVSWNFFLYKYWIYRNLDVSPTNFV